MTRSNRVFCGTLLFLFCLVALPASATAQLPDFSGRWVLNKNRSVPPLTTGQMRGGMMGVPLHMTITQNGDTLTIESRNELQRGARTEFKQRFAIDGKSWPVETESGEMTVTAEWKNNTLTITRTIMMEMRGQSRPMTQTEMWQVAESDGKIGMAVVIKPSQMGATGGGGQPQTGRNMGGRNMGGRSSGGGLTNIILVYDLRRRIR